jgi:hypothetical protein
MGKVDGLHKLILTVGVILYIGGGVIGCNDTNSVLVVEGPTKVLPDPECSFYKGVKEIAVLDKGDRAQIIGVRYPKDCMVYKIKLANGRAGYITHGDKFKVIEDQKK